MLLSVCLLQWPFRKILGPGTDSKYFLGLNLTANLPRGLKVKTKKRFSPNLVCFFLPNFKVRISRSLLNPQYFGIFASDQASIRTVFPNQRGPSKKSPVCQKPPLPPLSTALGMAFVTKTFLAPCLIPELVLIVALLLKHKVKGQFN